MMPASTHHISPESPERKLGPAAVARAYWPVQKRRWSPNHTAVALVTLLSLLLPACGPSTAPLIVQLRSADTHAPITSTTIEADSLALGPSLRFDDIIDELKGRRAAFTSHATTDQSGAATLPYVPGRALRITVLRAGFDVPFLLIDQDVDAQATDWLPMTGSPNAPALIELRAGTAANITLPPPAAASR